MRALQNKNIIYNSTEFGTSEHKSISYRERIRSEWMDREQIYGHKTGGRLVFAERKKKLLFMFMLLFFATPSYFSFISADFALLDKVLMAGELLSCLVIMMIWLQQRYVSPFFLLVTAMYGTILVSTILHGGNVYQTFRVNMDYVFLVMLVDNEKDDIDCLWDGCTGYLTIMAVINLVTMILYPEGMYETYISFQGQELLGHQANWFLANQNGLGKYLLCLLFFKSCLDFKRWRKLTGGFWVDVVICIASLSICRSATSIVCVTVMILLIAFTNLISKYRFALFNVYCFYIIIAAFFILFILVQNVGPFAYFITEILHKTIYFSGRTRIWSAVIERIFESPVIGFGYMSREGFKEFMAIRGASDAHNYFLTLGIYGGFVAIGLMLIIVFALAHRIRKTQYTKGGIVATAFMFSFFMMMLFENTTSKIYWCVLASIWYMRNYFGTGEEQDGKISEEHSDYHRRRAIQ